MCGHFPTLIYNVVNMACANSGYHCASCSSQ